MLYDLILYMNSKWKLLNCCTNLPSGETRLSSHGKVFMSPSFWVPQVTNWSEEKPECVPAKNVSDNCETTSRKIIDLGELNQLWTATGFSVQYLSQGWEVQHPATLQISGRMHSYYVRDCFCSFCRGRSTYLPPKQPSNHHQLKCLGVTIVGNELQ